MNFNPYLYPYNVAINQRGLMGKTNYYNDTLKEKMRKVWEQHVFWTRLVIISIIEHLKDEPETTARLLENPKDTADLFRPYYGNNVADTIQKLLTDHLVIASKLVHAITNNETEQAKELDKSWYKNADDIANALSSINSFYNKEELRKMLYEHLNLTKEEVTNRINKDYKKEIEIFDEIENQALMMADYFTAGILNPFKR